VAENTAADWKPSKPGFNGPADPKNKVVKYDMKAYFGESDFPKHYSYWLEMNDKGEPVNGGWLSSNPDFLWRPSGFKNFTGAVERNPYLDPAMVKEIYEKSIAPDAPE
jgi:hypothetical protein